MAGADPKLVEGAGQVHAEGLLPRADKASWRERRRWSAPEGGQKFLVLPGLEHKVRGPSLMTHRHLPSPCAVISTTTAEASRRGSRAANKPLRPLLSGEIHVQEHHVKASPLSRAGSSRGSVSVRGAVPLSNRRAAGARRVVVNTRIWRHRRSCLTPQNRVGAAAKLNNKNSLITGYPLCLPADWLYNSVFFFFWG